LQSNQSANSPISPPSNQYYHDNTYENYRQQYSKMPPATFQQQQNDQHLIRLSLEKNSSQTPPIQSHPVTSLDADEQQLLDAIHAHPNKRDLVLNLLRQMNESSYTSPMDYHIHHHQQQYARMSPATFQQNQNEQHLLHLSLASNQSPTSLSHSQSHPVTPLDADEQQLLDAIHAHPNKRDLVLNLLRQMNETSTSHTSPPASQYRSDSSTNYHPHRRD
jgi:hypothetical protein